MSEKSGFINAVSVSADDIADLSRAAFCQVLSFKTTENIAAHERWTDAVEALFSVCANKTETSWDKLSEKLAATVFPIAVWPPKSTVMRYAWEAATRHAVNCISAESRSEFDTVKDHDWREWVIKKCQSHVQTKEESNVSNADSDVR